MKISFSKYSQLLEMTCKVANVLKTQCGVKKGDRVAIYMPTSPIAVAAILACARIGAVHWYVSTCIYLVLSYSLTFCISIILR